MMFIVLNCTITAQTPRLDSLKASLPGLAGKQRFDVLFALANELEGILPRQALAYGSEALPMAREMRDSVAQATLLASASFCYCALGDFRQALHYAAQSLELSQAIGNKRRMASAHSTFGITYVYIGQYSKALEHHLEALRLREELGLDEPVVRTLNNIGIVYHNIGRYEMAIEYYKRALARHSATADTIQYIRIKHNLGFAEFKIGNHAAAMKEHTEALALAQRINYVGGMAYSLFNLGIMAAERAGYDEALEHLRRSLGYYEDLGQKPGIIEVLNALGNAYCKIGRDAEAIRVLERAAEMARQINLPAHMKTSYELLNAIYEKKGSTARAYHYFKLYSAAKDSLFNVTESNRIAEISMSLETIKKQREIDILKQEKTLADFRLERERYQSNYLLMGVFFLAALLLLLYWYSRNIRRSKIAAERSNAELERLNAELQEKIGEVRTLSGLLPICANCKKIRNDSGYWQQLEGYISEHSDAVFSHGICPDCLKQLYPDYLKQPPP